MDNYLPVELFACIMHDIACVSSKCFIVCSPVRLVDSITPGLKNESRRY